MSANNGHGGGTLIEQPLALRSYLEALLGEVPEAGEETVETEPREPVPAALPAVTAKVQAEVAEGVAQPVQGLATAPEPEARSRVPEWAGQTFQCLVFKVAGLSLAVPLVKLNGVIPWTAVTPMPNRSPMFLGLLHRQACTVKVVDTGLVVMPERAVAVNSAERQEGCGNIILIDDGRWGLACDGVGEVLTLKPSDVRWRSSQGRRPWLAGTVLQHLCAVLDADALAHLLATGERQGRGNHS